MTSRRPGPGGSWRRDGPSRGGRGAYYDEVDGQYSRSSRSEGSRSQIPAGARRGRAAGSEFYPDDSDSSYSTNMDSGQPVRNGRPTDYRMKRGQATEERQPFFASRRKPAYGLDVGSSVVRLLQTSGERELIPWLRSESQVGSMMSKIIKSVESIEDKLRTESYNGYSGSIWEADDPISGVLNDRTQDLIFRLKKTQDILTKPSPDVIDDVAECFYLFLSAGHILLVNRDTPKSCRTFIASTMASAAVLALKHGDPRAVLSCTTDHLRDSENDIVLLAFQHVLSRILIADTDGQKLFGTAHRVLDAQMDILETRSDEDTATTAIDIIGIISLRHPQAFKTRFRDIVDLLLGWYVDSVPSDRFFESCLKMFALCREKFRGEVEFGSNFIMEFAEHMDTAVKTYRKSLPSDPDVQPRATFLVFFQVYALLIHALTERIQGTARVMADPAVKQLVKSTAVSIIKGFTQILQSTDPDFSQFSARINKVLAVVISAMGHECIHIATLLYLHVRMQQTSALRLLRVTASEFAFDQSVFSLVMAIVTATKEHFPLEAAKDLLGPKSLIFLSADNENLTKEQRELFEAVLANSSEPVKDFIIRSLRAEYLRNIQTLAAHMASPAVQRTRALMASRPSENVGSYRLLEHPASGIDVSGDKSLKPLQGLLDSLTDGSLLLAADDLDGEEETAAVETTTGTDVCGEAIGHYCRKRIQVYLLFVQLWLTTDNPLEPEFSDGCYEVLVSQFDLYWTRIYPAIVLSHIAIARGLWQKKCTAIVVKDLMSSSRHTAPFPPEDLAFVRKTLGFLNRMLIAKEFTVVFDSVLRWADHALRTLLSLTTPFSELGIEAAYSQLLVNFFFLSFYGEERDRKLVRGTISDVFRTHGKILRKFLDASMLDLLLEESKSSDTDCAEFAEALLSFVPLQIALSHRYDDRQENPSLMQMDLDLQLAAVGDPEAAHKRFTERCFPFTYNIRMWKRLVWRTASSGVRDTQTVHAFFRKLFGLRGMNKLAGLGQIVESFADSSESTDSTSMVSSIGDYVGSVDLASSVCTSASDGIFGKPENFLSFVETLAQIVAPVAYDHTTFVHKTMLDLYISMKDAGMDVLDEWEDIRKLIASSSDHTNDGETTAKKPLEKRRIYSRTSGITAADVTAEPLSWLDVQQLQDRVFMMAEVFERCLERMVYGSALHATSMSEEEWFTHMQIVKNQYGLEKQVATAEKLLVRLKGILMRLAILREDSYSVVRLGYPAVQEVLATGNVTGSAIIEEVARSTVKALVELKAPRLIHSLSLAQQSSEFDSGISDRSFAVARLMAEQRFEEALRSLIGTISLLDGSIDMDSVLAPGELERELATDCFVKLNQWEDLSSILNTSQSLTDRENELVHFGACMLAPARVEADATEQLVRSMLARGACSQKDASELTAVLLKNNPALSESLLPEVLKCLKNLESRQRSLACFTKVEGRTGALRHVLEGFSTNDQGVYPLDNFLGLSFEGLPFEALHTCSRWITDDRLRINIHNQAAKLALRTENFNMGISCVLEYFSQRLQLDPDNFSSKEAMLMSSDVSSTARELAIIRRGCLSLASNMKESEYRKATVAIAKQNCVNAVRLIQELPEEYDACVVEIAKDLKHLNSLQSREDEPELNENIREVAVELRGQLPFVSYAGNAYETSETASSLQGELKELAYRFSMESGYSKPTFEYANWCYDLAFQHLTALQNGQVEDLAVELADISENLNLKALPQETLSRMVHSFMQSLPVRPSKSDGFAVLQVMQGSLDKFSFDHKTGGELFKEFQVSSNVLKTVNAYCIRKLSQVRGSLLTASRLYFESLGKELRPDMVVVAITRLLDILTAFPEEVRGVWEDATALIGPKVWKEFLPQMLGRLYHPNQVVTEQLLMVISSVAEQFPDEAIFPVVTGLMMANGVSAGPGECCPNIDKDAQERLQSAYQMLIDRLGSSFGAGLVKAASFAAEIQRISLLWDERWLQYLLSHQNVIRKTLKSAITSATNKTAALEKAVSEESEEEDSAGDDAAFVSSFSGEMHLSSSNKSSANLPEIDEGGELDLEAIKRQNSNLVVQSRQATPEVAEKAREDVQEAAPTRKDGKKFVKMPTYEHVSWRSRFNMDTYQTFIRPIVRAMQELLRLTSTGNSSTLEEHAFVRLFDVRLDKAITQLEKPDLSVEFDEDTLWSPFMEIMADLEKEQSLKRKSGLSLKQISTLHEIVASGDKIPIPGWSGNGTPVYIARIEDTVSILPTKTKPKKLAFWGSDGYKHTFLCKGLEDLAQDACLMQFIGMANKFFAKKFEHDHDIDRARTYSVVPFGPRAGLIQWVEGSTSLLTVYKSYLERQCFLGKPILAISEDMMPATTPSNAESQVKTKPEVAPQRSKFRVTEDELQEAYVIMQEQQYEAVATTDLTLQDKAPVGDAEVENLDILEEINFDSQDEFSPNTYVNHVYNTFLQKSRKDLQRLFKQPALPPRFLPNIHEMYMSYLVESLRGDPDVNWEKFRLHDRNRSKNIHIQHFKNAYNGLRKATRDDLLEKEIWFACSSSEEWWMVSRGFARSLAITSVVGYIIGLGDRHPDNLLVDFHTGEVVHVDYNVAFEKGQRLSIPERVPYRLTQNLTKALGWEGIKGSFRNVAVDTLDVFRKNQTTFSSLMGSYVVNPLLDWTTDKDEAVGLVPAGTEAKREKIKREKAVMFASKAWSRVREKLNGSDGPDGILDVPRQVDWTIETATDEVNLSRMFEGWIAWL